MAVLAPDETPIFLGRQAIFDRRTRVEAYELLYRSDCNDIAVFDSDVDATRTTVLNALTEFGLETVSGDRDIYVNFDRETLDSDLADLLPRDRTVIEILEHVEPDESTIKAIERLKADGWRIALDDFVFESRFAPLLEMADVVKIDLNACSGDELQRQLDHLRRYDAKLLAEKLETQSQFSECCDHGFDLFQGWFFCRPQLMEGRSLSPDRAGTVRLVAELQNDSLSLDAVASLISQDPAISVKLLKYINSAHIGTSRKVESIKHAASLVGRRKLRMWATMLGLGGMADKPRELLVAANVRARMCELIGERAFDDESGSFFTVGMFSLIDAILDFPLEEIVGPLPLSEPIITALLARRGDMGAALNAVCEWESGRPSFDAYKNSQITPSLLRDCYRDALIWTRDVMTIV